MSESPASQTKLIAAAIVIAGIVIAGAIVYQPTNRPFIQNGPTNEELIENDVVLGNPDAPVTLVIFGDYQCPFCKKMFDESEGLIREKYVDTGLVKLVYRDYPLENIHPYARAAAEAAQCAAPQNKYWEYHDALFGKSDELGSVDYVALAGELGLDQEAFRACVEAKTYAQEVTDDLIDGGRFGVQGTPANYINGVLLEGAYPYPTFERLIDEALQKAKK